MNYNSNTCVCVLKLSTLYEYFNGEKTIMGTIANGLNILIPVCWKWEQTTFVQNSRYM